MDSICGSSFRAAGPSLVANVLSPPTPTAWFSGVSARWDERAQALPSAVVGDGGRVRIGECARRFEFGRGLRRR
jgi:hypothetical protein